MGKILWVDMCHCVGVEWFDDGNPPSWKQGSGLDDVTLTRGGASEQDQYECDHCGYLCRVTEIPLGKDPAALLKKARILTSGEDSCLKNNMNYEAQPEENEEAERDEELLRTAATLMRGEGKGDET